VGGQQILVYRDSLAKGWALSSVGGTAKAEDRTNYFGGTGILLTPSSATQTIRLTTQTPIALSRDAEVNFWLYGGNTWRGTAKIKVQTARGGVLSPALSVSQGAGGWAYVRLTAAQLGYPTSMDAIVITTEGTSVQGPFTVDEFEVRT
jgi:hypothetical protein